MLAIEAANRNAGLLVNHGDEFFTHALQTSIENQLISQNPTLTQAQIRNEGRQILAFTLSDLVITKQLPARVQTFLENQGGGRDLISQFEQVLTMSEQFFEEMLRTHAQPIHIAVMNTASRLITADTITNTGAKIMSAIGVAYDSYALQTPEGQQKFDILLQAAAADITGAIVNAAVSAILSARCSLIRASLFMKVPGEIDLGTAFASMCAYNNILGKAETGLIALYTRCDTAFGNRGWNGMFMSRQTAIACSSQNDFRMTFLKSGSGALALQKDGAAEQKTIHGKAVLALPYIQTETVNQTDEHYLKTISQNWYIIPFYNESLTKGTDPTQFRKHMTTIEHVDAVSDHWVEFELATALANLPWFYQKHVDQNAVLFMEKPDDIGIGQLDQKIIATVAHNATMEYHYYRNNLGLHSDLQNCPFAVSGCNPINNENSLILLRALKGDHVNTYYSNLGKSNPYTGKDVVFVPVTHVGMLAESNCKTEYLIQIAKQVLSAAKKKGVDVTKIISSDSGKEVLLKKLLLKIIGIDHENRYVQVAKQAGLGDIPEWNGFQSSSIYNHRMKIAEELANRGDVALGVALSFVILLPIDVEIFRRMLNLDINCPLGVCMFRCTRRYSNSMIAMSKNEKGYLGKVFTSGINVNDYEKATIQSGERKQGHVEIGADFGFMISDNQMLLPLFGVQSSHPASGCGGNGSGFFPQRQNWSANPMNGSEMVATIEAGYSNFPFLTSLNAMVEKKFPEFTSVVGYFLPEMFIGHATTSREFGTNRNVHVYPGQQLFMYANRYLYRHPKNALNPDHFNFYTLAQEASSRMLAGMGSTRYWSTTGTKITADRNMDGPRLPGCRDRDSGLSVVGRGITMQTNRAGRNEYGVLVGAGGVHASGKRLKLGLGPNDY